ncbi:hypothetical protein B0J14DRAFT_672062 [Halenospora varia]|nr:hypothetical protein B0J14DRAFT_672062 [Halenospora varia]
MDICEYPFVVGGGSGIGAATAVGARGIIVAAATNLNFRIEARHIDVTSNTSVHDATAFIGVKSTHEISDADIVKFQCILSTIVTGVSLVTKVVFATMRSQEPPFHDPAAPERGVTRGTIWDRHLPLYLRLEWLLIEGGYEKVHSLVAHQQMTAIIGGVAITAVLPLLRAHPGQAKLYWGVKARNW